MLGPQGLDLFLAAGVGLDEIGADGLIGSAEGQQDEHGGHARAVLAAGAVEQHRRFTGFQRPEQLFVGLVAVEHPLVHGPGHPVALVGHPFQQGEAVFRGEIHFFAVFEAEAADLHQPGTVRHIVRGRGGFGAAAQVEDEAEAQAVQQLAVRRAGQAGRGDAAVDLPPFDVLALVGLIAAQLPEVVSARKRQGGAGCRVHGCGSGRGGAGKHRGVVERLGRASAAGRQAGGPAQHLHQIAAEQVDVGGTVVPALHQRDTERGQVFQQDVPHPVQLPPGPRLVPGQTGAELLLY